MIGFLLRKALSFAVFEPNPLKTFLYDGLTWVPVY